MINIISNTDDLRQLDQLRGKKPLVLVPTMGALHEGHLSLVKDAAKLGPVVVSIFVNPSQFGPGEDYQTYPRTMEKDLALLEPLGVSAVFAPPVEQMYAREGGVRIEPGLCAQGLCGEKRPGHFSGVLTVVAKLFGLVQPDVAIFGRKDAQQCLAIQEMVGDLKMPIKLIDAETVREPDGLAMSSRNRYLNSEQRARAVCLNKALKTAKLALEDGQRDRQLLETIIRQELSPADGIDYVEIRQVPTMATREKLAGRIVMAVAVDLGPARLIDNMVLDVDGQKVSESYLLGNGRN